MSHLSNDPKNTLIGFDPMVGMITLTKPNRMQNYVYNPSAIETIADIIGIHVEIEYFVNLRLNLLIIPLIYSYFDH